MSILRATLHKAIDEVDDKVLEAQFTAVMSGRAKSTEPADLAAEVMNVIKELFELHRIVESGENPENANDLTTRGNPMSANQLKERITKARAAIKNGEFTSHDDLKREAGEW